MKEKKKNKGIVIVIVIFIVIILSLTGYILMDKGVIPNVFESKEEEKSTTEKKDDKEKEVVEIDINNENIKQLFYNVHDHFLIGMPMDKFIYENQKSMVEQMEENYKFKLAANIFYNQITKYSTENGYAEEIEEEKVKSAYEQVFGPNTYQQVKAFNLSCGDYTYDSTTKKYVNPQTGCGGTSPLFAQENIIQVLKYQDKIEITSAFVFQEGNTLYKDIYKKDKIMDVEENINLTSYINQNKENLSQITYTFVLGEDGFYYYQGFEKTKE